MKILLTVLSPLALLIIYAIISCFLAYGVLLVLGDIFPLHKLISKSTLVLLILSIYPIMRWLKLDWQALGFKNTRLFFKQLGIGLILGAITLSPVLIALYVLDVHVFDVSREWTVGKVFLKVLGYLLLALLISILEEPLFRGILLANFKQKIGVIAAIIFSSIYYAALHFVKPKSKVSYEEMELSSGFELMLDAFANWTNPEILSAFIALMMVGIFLGILRAQIPYSIGLCIGCHTSWVWQIKLSKSFFNTNSASEYYYLVSSYDGVVGHLVSVWMLFAISVYLTYQHYRPKMNLA